MLREQRRTEYRDKWEQFKNKVKSLVKGEGWPIDPNTLPDHFDGVDIDLRTIDSRRPIESVVTLPSRKTGSCGESSTTMVIWNDVSASNVCARTVTTKLLGAPAELTVRSGS